MLMLIFFLNQPTISILPCCAAVPANVGVSVISRSFGEKLRRLKASKDMALSVILLPESLRPFIWHLFMVIGTKLETLFRTFPSLFSRHIS